MRRLLPLLFCAVFCFLSCHHKKIKLKNVVSDPAEMNSNVAENITTMLGAAPERDSMHLKYLPVLNAFYGDGDMEPIWSTKEHWRNTVTTLLDYIDHAALQGLFKTDYHFSALVKITHDLDEDSMKRKDAVQWARADLLLTDAFAGLLCDLKQGRLQPDSLSWKYDTARYSNFFSVNFARLKNGDALDSILAQVQPQHDGYRALKNAIPEFIDSMDTRSYTYLDYPNKDSLRFLQSFKKRMNEAGINIPAAADSAELSNAVKKYQKSVGLTVDGKIGINVIKELNFTDSQKFNEIAVTLDKYKQLPEKMPEKYVWVNLPAYYLKLVDADTIVFESKVICGKPATPTPLITSAISDIVIYPTWTVPASIITKDMLPGLKRNAGYLSRKGLYLLNGKGEHVDPATVNWARYSKYIPYRIQQGSGDDNSLGVMKFNFNNPFSVYLHDTNQRYLFKNTVRSLSHGCVRVQEWQQLANYIVRNDSIMSKHPETLKANTDSIANWIAHKERHTVEVHNRLPLFIRYFTCEAGENHIKFFDDIYGEDRALAQKYLPVK